MLRITAQGDTTKKISQDLCYASLLPRSSPTALLPYSPSLLQHAQKRTLSDYF
jgi:hypothetical protein